MADLCCPLAAVDKGKHQHHKKQILKLTRSLETCFLDDSDLGISGRKETEEDSAGGSSPKLPDEALHLMVLATGDRTLDEKMASV